MVTTTSVSSCPADRLTAASITVDVPAPVLPPASQFESKPQRYRTDPGDVETDSETVASRPRSRTRQKTVTSVAAPRRVTLSRRPRGVAAAVPLTKRRPRSLRRQQTLPPGRCCSLVTQFQSNPCCPLVSHRVGARCPADEATTAIITVARVPPDVRSARRRRLVQGQI